MSKHPPQLGLAEEGNGEKREGLSKHPPQLGLAEEGNGEKTEGLNKGFTKAFYVFEWRKGKLFFWGFDETLI